MGDVGQGERDQRRMAGDVGRALGLGVTHQRADLQPVAGDGDPPELVERR